MIPRRNEQSSSGILRSSSVNMIYPFMNGRSDGKKEMKALLGGKGANLCEMARCGLNVPPGFTITTEVCQDFYRNGQKLPDSVLAGIRASVALLEESTGQSFGGSPDNVLLLSVRSGAAVSMPGMMDTVLNLGLNDSLVEGLAKQRGQRFAYDCYRRLLQMFGDVVLGIPNEEFESCLRMVRSRTGAKLDVELQQQDLKEVIQQYKQVYTKHNQTLPIDPWDQLYMGIDAVFRSWNTSRAIKYREINKITGLKGTAVNVQIMVYGNFTSSTSGTGVCFTRNPANGARELFGEFLPNAQGEDVVAGTRTPLPVSVLGDLMPAVYKELLENTCQLEKHMRDMQDVEFTVQDGRLFMLQTRSGKRTGAAALKVATDLHREGLLSKDEALLLVEPRHLEQLLHPTFKDEAAYQDQVVATGLAASPGAAVGRLVFSAADAEAWHARGESVLLVRMETSPEDVGGMHAAVGILTARGGMTSHAAVVARGWGKPCVCGCAALAPDEIKKVVCVTDCSGNIHHTFKEGDWLSLNGTTGQVVQGRQPLKEHAEITGDLAVFMQWADQARHLGVMANVDTPQDARVARLNGAEGVGLCRTEHMFFSTPERIAAVRRMIAATELDSPAKDEALLELKGYQKEDFVGIFRVMDGLPVTIRLLDPPLHEFLPQEGPALTKLCKQLATELKFTGDAVRSRLDALREANPMMGLRGCRLGIVHPEITEMQATAIFEAAAQVAQEGVHVLPHVMVPLVGIADELQSQAQLLARVAKSVEERTGLLIPYKLGTMIEVPRGALQAGALAATAEFFSFGTNDLTQMTFGISRDDAQAKFLTYYKHHGILPLDPFETLDEDGVGELISMAVERGREAWPGIGLGICGEHGGDPASIAFFHKVGLDYVSCSPLRVPIARLAAAQAAIRMKRL